MRRFRSRAELRAIFAKIGQMHGAVREAQETYQDISLDEIQAGIQKAVKERPERLSHGHTRTNAFYIDRKGRIIQWDQGKASDGPMTVVHSHSADAGDDAGEPVGFSPGDVQSFLKNFLRAAKGDPNVPMSRTSAVFMRDGQLATLRWTSQTHMKSAVTYAKMGAQKFDDMFHMKKVYVPGKGSSTKQLYEAVKKFAMDIGLEYRDDLRWR